MIRLAALTCAAVLVVVGLSSPALADGPNVPVPGGAIGCGSGGCDINVGTPSQPGGSGGGDGSGGSSSSSPPLCTYVEVTPTPDEIATLGGQPDGPGAWYFKQCTYVDGPGGGFTTGGLLWLADPPPPVTPEQLARIARAQLRLPSVSTELSPSATTMVGVHVWLALSDGWASRSATASVPGLSVTATATPSKVAWAMGNGESKTCSGPGTKFRQGVDDPYAASPTCDYAYPEPSGEGNAFTVRATVSYTITWAGGGQSGTLDDLTGSGTTQLPVGESQAIVTR